MAISGFKPVKTKLLILSAYLIIPANLCGCMSFNTGALKMLAELNQNDKLKEQALDRETASFKKIKEFIDNSEMPKGISAEAAINDFGEPVLSLSEAEGEKWIYKPSDADWIGGEKIYLFFDKSGSLIYWECINCK